MIQAVFQSTTKPSSTSDSLIKQAEGFGAHNYHPLPVVLSRAEGEWVWDVEGKRYLDMLSAYSAINQGHVHPRMIATLQEQASKLTLSSRAFHNDQMGPWLEELTSLCRMQRAIAMNTGAEAVETAIKLARKWGYLVKKVPQNQAEILVCEGNFHGRTTTIVGFSSEEQYKENFGPFTPGFRMVPFGDAAALEKAITPHTVGFLVEPIQGEAGVVVPPEGYLKEVERICREKNVLFMVDEIQTGLARTGKMFAYEHDNVTPDLLILGKALGGGFYPISAVVGFDAVLSLLRPGDHGSTFGGNPLACALSRTALSILQDERLVERSQSLGEKFRSRLQKSLSKKVVKDVRGKGLLNAIEVLPSAGKGRFFSELLMRKGILAKETHVTTVRFAPALTIAEDSLEWALQTIEEVFSKGEQEWKNAGSL
jgi:ornithine--oxo-acid transaminase